MVNSDQHKNSAIYAILIVSGIILLGPYIGIRLFSSTTTEQSGVQPTARAPRASNPSVRKPSEQSDYSSIEDLLSK